MEKGGQKKSIKDDISRLRGLPQFRGVFLHHISRDFIMTVGNSLPCSNSTKNRYLALIRAILNKAATEWQWIDGTPKITLYREAKRRIRWLQKDEARRLVDALPEYMADMAVFSLATGLRQRNVLSLKWGQVDLNRKTVWIYPDEAKGGHSIGVTLSQTALAVLEKQIGRPFFCFCKRHRAAGKKISSHIWKNALQKAGITDFRCHDLRHTWLGRLVQAGVPLAAITGNGRLGKSAWCKNMPVLHRSICTSILPYSTASV